MITINDYFGVYANHPEIDCATQARAQDLLDKVNAMLYIYPGTTYTNPHTGTRIAGQMNGGWRPDNCVVGAKNSSHKEARGIDMYDPTDKLDTWLNDAILERYSLYREATQSTPAWVHLTTRPPESGNRTFIP